MANATSFTESQDGAQAAKVAGLRYVMDSRPGIARRRAGKGFSYVAPDGRLVRDAETLKRIRALVIPPAWTSVWISPTAHGHLQATGRDARGRKQYRYHSRWRQVRDATKYERMLAFAEALPRIRARAEEDLKLPGLPREKVLAVVVRLLELTHIRVGNEEYARTNQSFGLTTLRDHHVEIEGAQLTFQFRGKSGKNHSIGLRDRRLARLVRKCQEVDGEELFQYLDPQGEKHPIESGDVNAYLQATTGDDFTAKDFRTWAGTVLTAHALAARDPFDSGTEAKRNVVEALRGVARCLGNTPTVCRKCYVHPAILDGYIEGVFVSTPGVSVEETAAAVKAFLTERAGAKAA